LGGRTEGKGEEEDASRIRGGKEDIRETNKHGTKTGVNIVDLQLHLISLEEELLGRGGFLRVWVVGKRGEGRGRSRNG